MQRSREDFGACDIRDEREPGTTAPRGDCGSGLRSVAQEAGELPEAMGRKMDGDSQEREDVPPGQQGKLVPESLEAAGQDRTGDRSSQMRSSDESLPIPGQSGRYGQCDLGDARLEHQKDRPSPQAEGRKANPKGDETGRIGQIPPGEPSSPRLSSVVKEQN